MRINKKKNWVVVYNLPSRLESRAGNIQLENFYIL